MKALITIIAALILHGCITDRKALGRVLTNPDLVAQVAKTLPPCANDTTIVIDSMVTIETVTKYDTAYIYNADTLMQVVTKTIYRDQWKYRTEYIADIRLANQWRDSADKYRNSYLSKDEQLQAVTVESNNHKQQKVTRLWIIISLALALIITNGVWAYAKIKKPW